MIPYIEQVLQIFKVRELHTLFLAHNDQNRLVPLCNCWKDAGIMAR